MAPLCLGDSPPTNALAEEPASRRSLFTGRTDKDLPVSLGSTHLDLD